MGFQKFLLVFLSFLELPKVFLSYCEFSGISLSYCEKPTTSGTSTRQSGFDANASSRGHPSLPSQYLSLPWRSSTWPTRRRRRSPWAHRGTSVPSVSPRALRCELGAARARVPRWPRGERPAARRALGCSGPHGERYNPNQIVPLRPRLPGAYRGGPRGEPRGRPRGGPRGEPRGGPRGGPGGGPRGWPRGGPRGGPRGWPRGGTLGVDLGVGLRVKGGPGGGPRGGPDGARTR